MHHREKSTLPSELRSSRHLVIVAAVLLLVSGASYYAYGICISRMHLLIIERLPGSEWWASRGGEFHMLAIILAICAGITSYAAKRKAQGNKFMERVASVSLVISVLEATAWALLIS
jgi:hypothetical protein